MRTPRTSFPTLIIATAALAVAGLVAPAAAQDALVVTAARVLDVESGELRGAGHARATLEAGFTTVRNVGSRGFTDVALREAIRRRDIPGPRIVPAAHALSITGGHCDATGWRPGVMEQTWREGVADGPWDAVAARAHRTFLVPTQ